MVLCLRVVTVTSMVRGSTVIGMVESGATEVPVSTGVVGAGV